MPQADVARLLSNAKYRYQDQTKRDIGNALSHYRNLTPKLEKYVFPDGNQKDLVCLSGTIPVTYRGQIYNIPVRLWLTDTHPYVAPICYVCPTQDMTIKVSRHVDSSGRIYLPYLSDWKADTSDLLGAIQVMIIVFGETPPVYSKPKTTDSANTANTVNPPYPMGGFQPVPRVNQPVGPPTSGSGSTPYPTPFPGQYPYPTTFAGNNPAYNPPVTATTYPPYPSYPATSYPNPTQTSSQGGTGTITEEHIRASLLSAVEDKVKQKHREKVAQCQAEIDVLKRTSEDLNKGKAKLDDLIRRMEAEMVEVNDCKEQLQTKDGQLEELIEKFKENNKDVPIDEAFGPTQALYKQLLNSFAEENAIVDAIYYLGEALRKGVIDLEVFLKNVREMSCKQFMLRALMQTCREKAGLPC